MKKTFYITTPIYYPSDKLHIGHSYTTVAADAIARYQKLRGADVKFLTGTDEHGQKIERAAREKGVSPKAYVDEIVSWIQNLWEMMDIEYDIFIRTTDEKHEQAVQKIFRKLYDQGDIYKSEYTGWYCTPCETFFTERQLAEGSCPDCGRDVEKISEESYFFRLSQYQDRLIEHIQSHPDFIAPKSRQNEMINNFLKPGLSDLCVSRTSFKWGIPVEFDPGHVVYVWIDALSNYITALGYLSEDDSDYRKYWPADVQLVGKEIVRFHTIIWPAILMALGEPLPKQVFGHGWLVMDGGKMSKSKGNTVDPKILVEKYGVDAIRYFLLREVPFGSDGAFSHEALLKRMNADLANDLGNLLSRTAGMIDKYFGGEINVSGKPGVWQAEIAGQAGSAVSGVEAAMEKLLFSEALAEIWIFVRRMNKFADETAPWILAKDPAKKPELAGVLYTMAESLRIIAVLVSPFMPVTPKRIREQLGIADPSLETWESAEQFGLLPERIKISRGDVIFPRLDIKKELEDLQNDVNPRAAGETPEDPKLTQISPEAAAKLFLNRQDPAKAGPAEAALPEGIVTIDDFSKIKLKVGLIQECERVAGSDKLLKSKVLIGGETKQIVSGVARWYAPEDMAGRLVVVVTNLKPVKLRGEISEGMLLAAADDEGNLNLVTVDGDIAHGSEVR